MQWLFVWPLFTSNFLLGVLTKASYRMKQERSTWKLIAGKTSGYCGNLFALYIWLAGVRQKLCDRLIKRWIHKNTVPKVTRDNILVSLHNVRIYMIKAQPRICYDDVDMKLDTLHVPVPPADMEVSTSMIVAHRNRQLIWARSKKVESSIRSKNFSRQIPYIMIVAHRLSPHYLSCKGTSGRPPWGCHPMTQRW